MARFESRWFWDGSNRINVHRRRSRSFGGVAMLSSAGMGHDWGLSMMCPSTPSKHSSPGPLAACQSRCDSRQRHCILLANVSGCSQSRQRPWTLHSSANERVVERPGSSKVQGTFSSYSIVTLDREVPYRGGSSYCSCEIFVCECVVGVS